ncbi:PTS system fructose-specific EIIBC component [Sporomusa ovata DSM 2662]|uniref:PTS system, fructose-specific IIB component / PTS system, fructose-specific IIC component n=1 Tax=Sporomusa ovata TaxID=2378 RepID=A0A0U1L0I9_9FIRM|nr:fructose-specific PTS transporter subunit EIIC [Sporomusa ovata]EQB27222.1 PTS system fructose-specific EIIBBC component [Sporomusa ovata DSM 2662]CQR73065.1 PTS system, fructose-specific IIB component / PTS system, fructose-specific IIC component [Sporomusa ovata]
MKKILAVTACPTGIAHTYMAAEALLQAAKEKDVEIKVETRGAVGIENELTSEDISAAHAIIVAAATDVEESRFAGKPVVKVAIGEAIKDPRSVIDQALASKPSNQNFVDQEAQSKEIKKTQLTGPYKHLMTGVSYMLPLVVAGGLLIAVSFLFGIEAFKQQGTLAAALMDIGGGAAFALMVPILAGFIAFSIAEKPGLAPGLIGGMLATKVGAGFLGGIIAGFLAGYVAKWMKENINLPKNFAGLVPILIIPFFGSAIVGLLMIYVIGSPMKAVMDGLSGWLTNLGTGNASLLGLLLGAMMAFDMGGPVNKAAYTFAVGLLGSGLYGPIAAVMAAGMTPPLGLWLATVLAPKKFSVEEREAGKAAGVLGISFITEGAIPFAAADPFRIIPSIMAGSAVAGALSMALGATLRAPHGGIFVLLIPNAVGNLAMYVLSILAGTVVTAVLISIVKKNKTSA